jgi:hypothetical protein
MTKNQNSNLVIGDIRNIIKNLYIGMLCRAPNYEIVDHWANLVQSGLSIDDLVTQIAFSAECITKRNSEKLLFVPPGHFYSPIVDPDEIKSRYNDDPALNVEGVDINKHGQMLLWNKFVNILKKIPFPTECEREGFRYYFNNPAFSVGDASIYFAMLLEFQPSKIVEIGSGFSSACALDTNELFLNNKVQFTFIEPYPKLLQSLLKNHDKDCITIIESCVQDVDLDIFSQLKLGDFLFIDSTHIVKTASDVNYEIFEIIPSLNSGVIIHIHDIFWPFEYPRQWVFEEKRAWNELYAIRALLMYQNEFEILFFNDYFAKTFDAKVFERYPNFLSNPGGSLWLRKR